MDRYPYQEKIWGVSRIVLSPTYLAFLRLKYCLEALARVKGKVLDAGCGGGGFTKAVAFNRPDLEVCGVDIGRQAIKVAKENAEGVKFRVGNLYELHFEDNSFDAVIMEDVLEHLEEPAKALSEANRILKRGGVFHAFTPLEGEPYTLYFWLKKLGWREKEKLAGHIQEFRLAELRKRLSKAGLNLQKMRFSTHFLGQLVDISYYSFFGLTGKKFEPGLEGNLKNPFLKFTKEVVTFLTNIESSVSFFLPGAGIHLTCRKRS